MEFASGPLGSDELFRWSSTDCQSFRVDLLHCQRVKMFSFTRMSRYELKGYTPRLVFTVFSDFPP